MPIASMSTSVLLLLAVALQPCDAGCVAQTLADIQAGYRTLMGCPNANPTTCACVPKPANISLFDCPNRSESLWDSAGEQCFNATPSDGTAKHVWPYPADYADSCTSNQIEPGQKSCTTVGDGTNHVFSEGPNYNSYYNSSGWCTDKFCWVDPCSCDTVSGVSSWFQDTPMVGKMFYSYPQCNNSDGYGAAACGGYTSESTCDGSAVACKWEAANATSSGTTSGSGTSSTSGTGTNTSSTTSSTGTSGNSSGTAGTAANSAFNFKLEALATSFAAAWVGILLG